MKKPLTPNTQNQRENDRRCRRVALAPTEKGRVLLPAGNAREWYWALMDYGTHIKQQFGNKSRASKSYTKQSPFKGSKRAVRGAVIRALAARPHSYEVLEQTVDDPRLEDVLHDLVREGLVAERGDGYSLA